MIHAVSLSQSMSKDRKLVAMSLKGILHVYFLAVYVCFTIDATPSGF
jgi:hypothetical protein